MIRKTVDADKRGLLEIISDSGQFDEASLTYVQETLESHLNEGSDALWFTADDGEPVGVAYCAPEPVTEGTWNLLMLWIRKDREGHGHGSALMSHLQESLAGHSARLLIVETSGTPEFETARSFYSRCGFTREARIKDFFAAGDDKLIYTKGIRIG